MLKQSKTGNLDPNTSSAAVPQLVKSLPAVQETRETWETREVQEMQDTQEM